MNQNTLLTSSLVKWLLIVNALFILFVMAWWSITLSEMDSMNQQLYDKLVQQHDILTKRSELSTLDLIALDDLTKGGMEITAVIADYMYYFKSYLAFLLCAVVVSVLGAWKLHRVGRT
jgi:hypothetical protein